METFHIIQHHNTPHEATLKGGRKVYRQEKIYIEEENKWYPVAPYDNHFIYETKRMNFPAFLCTCGAIAVITDFRGYEKDASPQGKMFVCLNHATFGKHADGCT